MTVDFGAHLFPDETFPEPIDGSETAELLGPRLRDPETLAEFYQNAGVDIAVLSQPYYMGHDDLDETVAANDALLDIVTEFEQFRGLAAIPTPTGGDAAAAEFERCLERGYHGGAIETESHGVELTDTALEPVFEVAVKYDAPLLVHPKLDQSLHPDALDDSYLNNAIFGREAALSASICKVIHEGILESYPDLSLVYHHLGGNIASMLGRIHLQLDDGRWPGQEKTVPFEEFREQLERIYIDTSGFFGYEQPLEAAADVFPPSQLLFGSDYPFEPRTPGELRRFTDAVRTTASEDAAEKILTENAVGLLRSP